jgi:hypothetical protein
MGFQRHFTSEVFWQMVVLDHIHMVRMFKVFMSFINLVHETSSAKFPPTFCF